MLLWRISEFVDLTGIGGTLVGGRWNTRGAPIVYSAETSALALLEVLVGLQRGHLPADFQLLMIDADEAIGLTAYAETTAPAIDISRRWGDAWLKAGRTALARVPSAVAPYSSNILINPAHADAARITIAAHGRWPWDRRLLR